MTQRAKFTFSLPRIALALLCIMFLVFLMQSVSYFSLNNQAAQAKQSQEVARILAQQVAFSLSPLLQDPLDATTDLQIHAILKQLTQHSRILDIAVYRLDGSLIAQEGEEISVKDRLAIDGARPGSYFNQQLVETIEGKNLPLGFIRLTLDTHTLATEAEQVDNTTNVLRLMLIAAVGIGMLLTHVLLNRTRSPWKQSPYLLTIGENNPPAVKLTAKRKRLHKKKPYH